MGLVRGVFPPPLFVFLAQLLVEQFGRAGSNVSLSMDIYPGVRARA